MALLSTRLVLEAPSVRRRLDHATARAAFQLEQATADALAGARTARIVDRTLQGPLPETVARSVVRNRVPARMLREALELREEQPIDGAFDAEVGRLLASPVVRSALVDARTSATDEFRDLLRSRAETFDMVLERQPRRWLGRKRRPARVQELPYPAGLVTRAIAFSIDAFVIMIAFAAGAVIVGAAVSLVAGGLRPAWLVAAIGAVALSVVQIAYFAGSWTLTGQTLGMRLMRVRVVDPSGAPPGAGRSLVRWIGLVLSIIPCFAGFLPVLVDDQRRSIADLLAGTTVVSDGLSIR